MPDKRGAGSKVDRSAGLQRRRQRSEHAVMFSRGRSWTRSAPDLQPRGGVGLVCRSPSRVRPLCRLFQRCRVSDCLATGCERKGRKPGRSIRTVGEWRGSWRNSGRPRSSITKSGSDKGIGMQHPPNSDEESQDSPKSDTRGALRRRARFYIWELADSVLFVHYWISPSLENTGEACWIYCDDRDAVKCSLRLKDVVPCACSSDGCGPCKKRLVRRRRWCGWACSGKNSWRCEASFAPA